MRKTKLKPMNELKCFGFYGPALIIYTMLSIMSTVMLFFYSFTDWNGLARHFNFAGIKAQGLSMPVGHSDRSSSEEGFSRPRRKKSRFYEAACHVETKEEGTP